MDNYFGIQNYERFLIRMNKMKIDAIFSCKCEKDMMELKIIEDDENEQRSKIINYEFEIRKELTNEIYFILFFFKFKKITWKQNKQNNTDLI